MTRIGLCVPLPPALERHLQASLSANEHLVVATDESDAAPLADCDVIFGNPPAATIAAAPSLRWVQLESVGFGEYTGLDWATLGGKVRLTNLAGFFANPVAETALAGILALLRGIDTLVALKSARQWEGDPLRTRLRELGGARVVLVGYGAINRRLAELLAPFGCAIVPIRRDTPAAERDAALAGADVVVATAPDTPDTRGLFDRDRLALLPRGAIFANLGRGSLVDEAALADALESGQLAGAVLDVTRDEQLPPSHRFWTCPNTILTQHTGGGTGTELERKVAFFLDNLSHFRAGLPLQNIVDFGRGY